ncbi:aconitate hydratase [Fusibacter sp. 3D3]|uniref:aconitate hydratase n=1 Tax=Fusibacter sp. 3D3 TaxID=1048380 RepID=UPI00085308FA|nr:aconitate hydratase [Fusibacter sp. 3D3]GAU76372.1 aconitate hydratase [Fusibacter sp. 3D3]
MKSLFDKIIDAHLISKTEDEICIKVHQTLTQDTTGTMAYLQLEAMQIEKVATELSVAYIDHNTLQTVTENADDHEYIRSCADRFGIVLSKAGSGICHQVHLERFAKPTKVLLGSDSHTPTAGGIGMLAIGAGGLDVATAMATGKYFIRNPKKMKIQLDGIPAPGVTAKDIILAILQKLTVKGGVGYIIEYGGTGVRSLDVPDRAVLTNMGAELGATTSIFPSDSITHAFLKRQNREDDFTPLYAEEDAQYDDTLILNLSEMIPMVAKPHAPDNVTSVSEIEGLKVNQVAIGSCTNASFSDLMQVSALLKGKQIAAHVSLSITPGSSNVYSMLAENGALSDMIKSGARILEPSCGPCIGMGQAPISDGVSLRTFNRNFKGRCGTPSAGVYLVSPLTAALSAIAGQVTVPKTTQTIELPKRFTTNDSFLVQPTCKGEIVRGPNIKPLPASFDVRDLKIVTVGLITEDNITTDDIVPSTSSLLPFRSNIPYLSEYCFIGIDPEFPKRCQSIDDVLIIGGKNYGQGSSREHAALVPLYLKVRVVLAKSFARIHRSNLINAGIVPLVFNTPEDYDHITPDMAFEVHDLESAILEGTDVSLSNNTLTLKAHFVGSARERQILLNQGYLNYIKNGGLT